MDVCVDKEIVKTDMKEKPKLVNEGPKHSKTWLQALFDMCVSRK